MKHKEREVTDVEDIRRIIDRCDVCRLALNDSEGFPYIIPLNFGYALRGDRLTLFFHSAMEGHKIKLMEADNRAAFEMDCGHELVSQAERGYCTMNYESVTGRGRIEFIEDDTEKIEALTALTDRYHPTHFEFNRAAVARTKVYRLVAESFTAKRKATKTHQ